MMSNEEADSSEEQPTEEVVPAPAPVSGGGIEFKKNFEIFPGKPLAQYDAGRNRAYEANDRRQDAALVAIVCERQFVPRLDEVTKYQKINSPNVLRLVEYGVVYWPSEMRERFVFVYERSGAEPLAAPNKGEAAYGWKIEEAIDVFIKPMIMTLQAFKENGFVHGSICPNNMFLSSASEKKLGKIVLGDALSLPISYVQSATYASIERAMADPVARGAAMQTDDLYSLGASLMVLLRSSDPMKGYSEDDIIRQKSEQGSYVAMAGKERFKGDGLEVLRGLLHDDPAQRWTFEELMAWGEGRRLSPKQSLVRKKASRPFHFMDDRYLYLPSLAMAVDKSPIETKKVVEDDTLVQWLERAANDEIVAERVAKAIQTTRDAGTGVGYQERLSSSVSANMDSYAPLRFKGASYFPSGIGYALAEAFVMKGDLKPHVEIISQNIMINWLGCHENPNINVSTFFPKFEACKRHVRGQKIGEGIERCLYVLNPNAPCMSEALDKHLVTHSKELLLAFEDQCSKGKTPRTFLDRHVVAFLMERDSKVIEFCLYDLNSGTDSKTILGNLRCLAEIQGRYDVGKVPALSKVFGDKLDPVYELYHDRQVRDKLKKGVEDCAKSGDLQRMLRLFEDPDIVTKDAKGFKAAVAEYNQLFEEGEDINGQMDNKSNFGLDLAREWTAIASGVLAVVVFFGAILTLFAR